MDYTPPRGIAIAPVVLASYLLLLKANPKLKLDGIWASLETFGVPQRGKEAVAIQQGLIASNRVQYIAAGDLGGIPPMPSC